MIFGATVQIALAQLIAISPLMLLGCEAARTNLIVHDEAITFARLLLLERVALP